MTTISITSRGTLAAIVCTLGLAAAVAQELKTDDEKTLYAVGQALGQQVARFGVSKGELAFVVQGLTDAAAGTPSKVDMSVYGPKIQEMARVRMQAKVEAEKAKAKPFLEAQAKEKGAQQMPSGLIYIEQKAGTGTEPKAEDRVKVHYRGTLIDGTEFDSSYKRNAPAEFPLSGVIPCWTEGVQKMKPGGKAKLVCPAAIGYGDRGTATIPGGATLIFEVELVEVLPPPPPAAAPAPAPSPAPTTKPAPAPAPQPDAKQPEKK